MAANGSGGTVKSKSGKSFARSSPQGKTIIAGRNTARVNKRDAGAIARIKADKGNITAFKQQRGY